eukprot:4250084-Pleurochrysis_carterae.AAC.1
MAYAWTAAEAASASAVQVTISNNNGGEMLSSGEAKGPLASEPRVHAFGHREAADGERRYGLAGPNEQ